MVEIEKIVEKVVEVPVEVVVYKDRNASTTGGAPAASAATSKTMMGDDWSAGEEMASSSTSYSTAAACSTAPRGSAGASGLNSQQIGMTQSAWGARGGLLAQTKMETQKVLVGYQPKYEVMGSAFVCYQLAVQVDCARLSWTRDRNPCAVVGRMLVGACRRGCFVFLIRDTTFPEICAFVSAYRVLVRADDPSAYQGGGRARILQHASAGGSRLPRVVIEQLLTVAGGFVVIGRGPAGLRGSGRIFDVRPDGWSWHAADQGEQERARAHHGGGAWLCRLQLRTDSRWRQPGASRPGAFGPRQHGRHRQVLPGAGGQLEQRVHQKRAADLHCAAAAGDARP